MRKAICIKSIEKYKKDRLYQYSRANDVCFLYTTGYHKTATFGEAEYSKNSTDIRFWFTIGKELFNKYFRHFC